MAPNTNPQKQATRNDSTFRAYSSEQANEYAQRRGGYPPALIDQILQHHTSTGGQLGTLLDLGCGPGNSTRDLAIHFSRAIGLDPSSSMISAARSVGGSCKSGQPIEFRVGEAEFCSDIPDGSVDLITAATSAHWFDMAAFWPTAARVLRKGGAVAMFTIWRTYPHPTKMPKAAEVHAVLRELEQGEQGLGPYQKGGNWTLMGLYHDLRMPWEIEPACMEFEKEGFERRVWNEDGKASEDGSFLCGERWVSFEDFERSIGTISAATRWREAHADLAFGERDVIRVAFKKIRGLVEKNGVGELCMVGPSVVVSLKRR